MALSAADAPRAPTSITLLSFTKWVEAAPLEGDNEPLRIHRLIWPLVLPHVLGKRPCT